MRLPLLVCLVLLQTACGQQAVKPVAPPPSPPVQTTPATPPAAQGELPPVQIPVEGGKPVIQPQPVDSVKAVDYTTLQAASWEQMEGLQQDDLRQAWPAWLQSCSTLVNRVAWKAVCERSAQLNPRSSAAIHSFLRQHFDVYRATNVDGSDTGLITGYYQPLLKGSRKATERYRYPLYSRPTDLITVELGELYPELANKRVRGRLVDGKLLPYYPRSDIEAPAAPLRGLEFMWVDDIIDLFFLQVQGSGIIQLESGERVPVGYADQNGYSYQSIGRVLVDRGEMTLEQASMQSIKQWGRNNPDKLRELLNQNPSYVFFRELPAGLPGPLGALGVPIAAQRSVAVDPRYIPLGAPLFLSTTQPNSSQALRQLMLAQDTGGAIKGGVRADFYWGAGAEAGQRAGAMKQPGKIWVLLPKGFKLRAASAN